MSYLVDIIIDRYNTNYLITYNTYIRSRNGKKSPLLWSSAPVGTKYVSLQDDKRKRQHDADSNWFLTTKYASLPRKRGSLRMRHPFRPETSLPLDEQNASLDKSDWISELHRSFIQMPSDAFEKPNKEFRRLQYRKQSSLTKDKQLANESTR